MRPLIWHMNVYIWLKFRGAYVIVMRRGKFWLPCRTFGSQSVYLGIELNWEKPFTLSAVGVDTTPNFVGYRERHR